MDKLSDHKSCRSYEFGNIHRHFVNLCGVILFNIPEYLQVFISNKINGHTFSSEPSTSSDSVDIKLSVRWQVIVNYQRNLLHIKTPAPKISCYQNTRIALSKLRHNSISFLLVHVSMHAANCKVVLYHFL